MAKINLKYSRRLDALVLKPGKRDAVSYRLVSRLASVRSSALLGIERGDPADEDAPFYYGVAGLARLDAFLSRPLSLVQFRCLLESLRAVMELCVGEGLPQGNVCFDPACVFVDGGGAMRFAFVPFERVDGAGSALELLEYLSRRRVRMVLPQDEALRDEVANFARSVSVLSAADFSAFLEARFGVRDSGAAPGERERASCVGDVSGVGAPARPALSVDPVALMAGRAPERMVARSVADDLASLPHSGPLACVPETSELSRSRCGDRDEDGSAPRPDSSPEGGSAPSPASSPEGGSAPSPASSPDSSPERLSPRQASGPELQSAPPRQASAPAPQSAPPRQTSEPAPQSVPGCKDGSSFVPESRSGRPAPQPGQPGEISPGHPAVPVTRLILERVRDGARYALPEGPAVIGRSQTCDISIAGNGALSRRHVRVDAKAGTIEDLGSANGTFVGGTRLPAHRPEPLGAGESFFLADEEFRLRAE